MVRYALLTHPTIWWQFGYILSALELYFLTQRTQRLAQRFAEGVGGWESDLMRK